MHWCAQRATGGAAITGIFRSCDNSETKFNKFVINPAKIAAPVTAGIDGGNIIAMDPTGRFMYVSDLGSTIDGFTIDQSTGVLTPIGAVTGYSTNLNVPEDVLVDHTGKYLYAINNGGTNGTVSAYSITQTTGALTPLSAPTIVTGPQPFLATLSPTQTYMFRTVETGQYRFIPSPAPVYSPQELQVQ
jgi:DNA-binding beta-propeller fold protein YncE